MEQRCEFILQNYFKTCDITDYKIIKVNVGNYGYFIINYNCKTIFYMINIDNYIKYNIQNTTNTKNNILKEYKHNEYIFYYNNKNIYINLYFFKNNIKLFKIICNNKECKYYNNFFKMYKKIFNYYSSNRYFLYYYYKINLYIYKKYSNIYNIKKLYSNQYSIMFLFIFVLYNYIIIYIYIYIYIYIMEQKCKIIYIYNIIHIMI